MESVMEDLYRELSEKFDELGESEISDYLREEYKQKEKRERDADVDRFIKRIEVAKRKMRVNISGKIYPNELCPCGSGIKYKKCCGENRMGVRCL